MKGATASDTVASMGDAGKTRENIIGSSSQSSPGSLRWWDKVVHTLGPWGMGLLAGIVVGLLAIAGFASQYNTLGVFSSGLLVAGAAGLSGTLLGLIFGIPRSPKNADDSKYKANTNLEDISDWLTKIIVGVGLVQLGRIGGALGRFSKTLAPSFGGGHASGGFGLAIVVFYAVAGFMLGYIWTRTGFTELLSDLKGLVVKTATQTVANASNKDANALRLADSLLAPGGSAHVDPNELNAAVKDCSDRTKVELFQRTRNLYLKAKKLPDPSLFTSVETLLRALVDADQDGEHHRNRAWLGYTLLAEGKLQDAVSSLSDAIAVRDKLGIKGWKTYELKRAIARIAQGNTDDATRAAITSDLNAAATDPKIAARLQSELAAGAGGTPAGSTSDETVAARWMHTNGIRADQIGLASAPGPPARGPRGGP